MRILFFFIISLLISCSSSSILSKKAQNITGVDFFSALALGYNQLSIEERKEYDWKDADNFADKGLAAIKKKYIPVDNPFERDIKDNLTLEELIVARNKLIDIFDDNTKLNFPFKSARLQILYDYWLEQAEENWQIEDIKRYRIEFWQTYEALRSAKYLASLKLNKKIGKDNYYSVYFDHNKDNLDKVAQLSLNKLIYYLQGLEGYRIILEGHTDLSGDKHVNYILAKSRLLNVKNMLIKRGVKKTAFIREEIYGSARPKITKSAGGYVDRLNRRVEIYIIPVTK